MNARSLTHLFVALGFLAVVIALYSFWYFEVVRETKRSAELASQIYTTIESTVRAEETSDTLAELMTDEAAINSYVVKLADVVPFLERIEGTGRSIGSSVEVVSVADKPGADGRVTLSVRIIGSFDVVLRTLGAIEYGPYDSRVTNLTFDNPAGGKAWTAVVSLSVATDAVPTK